MVRGSLVERALGHLDRCQARMGSVDQVLAGQYFQGLWHNRRNIFENFLRRKIHLHRIHNFFHWHEGDRNHRQFAFIRDIFEGQFIWEHNFET